MTQDDSPYTEEEKDEIVEELKHALSGWFEGALIGVASAFLTLMLARSGVIPLVPQSLTQLELAGFWILFSCLSVLTYLYRTRPHNRRLDELFEKWKSDGE